MGRCRDNRPTPTFDTSLLRRELRNGPGPHGRTTSCRESQNFLDLSQNGLDDVTVLDMQRKVERHERATLAVVENARWLLDLERGKSLSRLHREFKPQRRGSSPRPTQKVDGETDLCFAGRGITDVALLATARAQAARMQDSSRDSSLHDRVDELHVLVDPQWRRVREVHR